VAGIVAGNNGPVGAPSGVARDADLIAVQVFSQFSGSGICGLNPTCPQALSSDLISALQYVFSLKNTYNIASVNMSLGGGQYLSNCDSTFPSFKTAVDNLRAVGIATVIASGNNGYTNSIGFPACISSAISVGATDKAYMVASFSNSASLLNLLAPGSSITSSYPGGLYATANGTSMATPHVAGAWAVLKSAKPTATVSEILTALVNTGKPISDSRNNITKPRIQVDQAVYAIGPTYFVISDSVINGVGGTITSSGSMVPYGGSITFTITHALGYTLTGLTDNGVIVTAVEGPAGTFTYSISNVTANHTVIATFAVTAATAVPALPPLGLSAAILIAAILGYRSLSGIRQNDNQQRVSKEPPSAKEKHVCRL
jgi:subtilisin family serine protease